MAQSKFPIWCVEEFSTSVRRAADDLAQYVQNCHRAAEPVSEIVDAESLAELLTVRRWIESGGMTSETFSDFLHNYLAHSTRLHHPAYLAHQVAVPSHASALAELVHGVINNPMAIYEMGPSAAVVELTVINWMLEKIGWTPQPLSVHSDQAQAHAAGVLTHGGSLANLTALLAARAAIAPDAWQNGTPDDLTILAPSTSHYSVAKAIGILGLGARAIWHIPLDRYDVIKPDALPILWQRIQDQGRRCMALVANACTTATGLYDPLEEIGHFCQEVGIWFHADACHGASALLSDKERHWLRGIERADSIIWDAHKMLCTSSVCTAVLFKDATAFDRASHQEASYLFYDDGSQGVDLIHRTVECTKAELGLKLFLTLAWHGEQGIGRYVENRYAMAKHIYSVIKDRDQFDCPYEPQSNILCFRYGNDDELQIKIRENLLKQGRFHLSSATVAGKRYLRLSIMSPKTDEETIERLLDTVEQVAADLI